MRFSGYIFGYVKTDEWNFRKQLGLQVRGPSGQQYGDQSTQSPGDQLAEGCVQEGPGNNLALGAVTAGSRNMTMSWAENTVDGLGSLVLQDTCVTRASDSRSPEAPAHSSRARQH